MKILILCGIELLILDILIYKYLRGENFTRKEAVALIIFQNVGCIAIAALNTLLFSAIWGQGNDIRRF